MGRLYFPIELKRSFTRLPWGYTRDPNNAKMAIPNKEALSVLEKGKDYLDEGASFEMVAKYISQKSGVSITSPTVKTYYEADEERAEGRKKRASLVENYTINHGTKRKVHRDEQGKVTMQIATTKKILTHKQKKLKKLQEKKSKILAEISPDLPPKPEKQVTEVSVEEVPAETIHAEPMEVIKPNPGPQTEFLAASEFEILFGGPLALDTLVLTDSGEVPLRDLKIGSSVFTPKGTLSKVIDIPFDGEEESYEIEFNEGSKVIASAGHEWLVGTSDWGKTDSPWRIKRTFELLDFKLSRNRNKYKLPIAKPLVWPSVEHTLSPYTVGAFLGDGCLSNKKNLYVCGIDTEVFERIDEESPENYRLNNVGGIYYKPARAGYGHRGSENLFVSEFRRLGLLGTYSYSKFIPKEYLFDSYENRLALLQGLMDTDGTTRSMRHNRKCPEAKFTTVSPYLARDFKFLASSLGFDVHTTVEKKAPYLDTYRIIIQGTENPFYISRKRKSYADFKLTRKHVYITNIRNVGVQKVRCITIEDPEHLFLLSSCIITRNSAGPGKSWALNVDPLRTVHLASHRAITFRRTNDELRELIWMTKELYPKIIPGAKFQEQKSTWVFPGGGTHWFRYLDRDEDVLSMQGQSYTWVGFDELTQWTTPFVYNYMRSRVRTTDDAIRPYLAIRSTSNPGGPGHGWVKQMFIDPAKPNTPFPATDLETGKVLVYPPNHERAGQPLFYRRFIPALLKDNPYLIKDTSYEASLLSLPETQRRQLLEGDWDIAEGAAFTEFRRSVHVCDPFDIPPHWTRFRACDWGYDQPYCVLWFAVDSDNKLYVYRELYGRKKVSSDLAKAILAAEEGENLQYGVLDSHCWDKRDGNATVEENMRVHGCFWRPAANRAKDSRVPTKQEIHRRLQVIEDFDPATGEKIEKANVVIFSNCVNLVRTLPSIPIDKNNPEDVNTDSEDHAYDAFRYGCASRPLHRNLRPPVHLSAAPSKRYDNFGFPI